MSRKLVSRHTSRYRSTQETFSRPSGTQENKRSSFQGQTVMSRFICLGVAALAASMTLGFSGCCSSGYGGGGLLWGFVDQFMQQQVACMQERVWARRAFHLRYGHCERIHADHFRDGFVSGYCNACDGGGTDVPALPPEKYWGFQYRNQEGVDMQTAWFEGYEAGAQSAVSDGPGAFQNIQVSRQIEQAIASAQQVDDMHSGIYREYAFDNMNHAPLGSGLPDAKVPQTNMPYIIHEAPVVQSPPMNNTPLAQPMTVPAWQTGAGANTPMPMPMQSSPPVPVIRGSSQK